MEPVLEQHQALPRQWPLPEGLSGECKLLSHNIMTCQVGAQRRAAPHERAGAGITGDALTSFLHRQCPTEPESLGTIVLPASGTSGNPGGLF